MMKFVFGQPSRPLRLAFKPVAQPPMVLRFKGSVQSQGGGASALADLTDVALVSPIAGNLLRYNALGLWENYSVTNLAADSAFTSAFDPLGAAAAVQGNLTSGLNLKVDRAGDTMSGRLFIQSIGSLTPATANTYALEVRNSVSSSQGVAIGSDNNFGYIQSFGSVPLLLNRQGNFVIIGSSSGGGKLGLYTTAPTHSITLSSLADGIAAYNTSDQTTNYERVRMYWNANEFLIYGSVGGSGTARAMSISALGTSAQSLALNVTSLNGFVEAKGTSAASGAIVFRVSGTLSSASGTQYGVSIIPTINQSSTAGYTALLVNPSHTAIGSGLTLLADFQLGGSSLVRINSAGAIIANATQMRSNVGLSNDSSVNNSFFRTLATGAVIERNVADANVTLVVQQLNASATGDLIQFKNSSTTVAKISLSGLVTSTGLTNTGTLNNTGTQNQTGTFNQSGQFNMGDFRRFTTTNINTAPDSQLQLTMLGRGFINSIAAYSGQPDLFYNIDRDPTWTITSNYGTVANLFNGDLTSNLGAPVASLAATPLVVTIEKNDGTNIGNTDVYSLLFTGHRLGNDGAVFTDYTVEVKNADNNWTLVLVRSGVSDSMNYKSVPLHVSTDTYPDGVAGAGGWHLIRGIRLTVSGAVASSFSAGNLQLNSIQLRDSRPQFTPAQGLGAMDTRGGKMFGAVGWYRTPTHTITLGTLTSGIAYYNTDDQTTNYERVRLFWSSNVFRIDTGAGGSGVLRDLALSASGTSIQLGASGSYGMKVERNATSLDLFLINSTSMTHSSAIQSALKITPVISQSGSGGYAGILLNVTETATGSGSKSLMDLQVGGVSKFKVSNVGRVTVDSVDGNAIDTDGTLAANSDTKLASQKATKTYADTKIPNNLVTAKGDLIGASASATPVSVPVGADGQVLTADSTSTPGVKWATPSGGGGGLGLTPTAVKTANYTAAVGDMVLADTNTTGAFTVTLPSAPADKSLVAVKHVLQGSTGGYPNILTIARGGSDTFNKASGPTSITMPLVNSLVILQYQSSTGVWHQIADHQDLSILDSRSSEKITIIPQSAWQGTGADMTTPLVSGNGAGTLAVAAGSMILALSIHSGQTVNVLEVQVSATSLTAGQGITIGCYAYNADGTIGLLLWSQVLTIGTSTGTIKVTGLSKVMPTGKCVIAVLNPSTNAGSVTLRAQTGQTGRGLPIDFQNGGFAHSLITTGRSTMDADLSSVKFRSAVATNELAPGATSFPIIGAWT